MLVRFATPCLTHHVALEFLISALQTEKLLNEQQVPHIWANRPGDPFIAKARSSEACEALADLETTDLFFLDDDIAWPPEKVLEFLESDAPVIAGVYPHKLDTVSWPCSLEASATSGELIRNGNLVKAVLAPTGFMRIKRWVLEKLYETAPPYKEIEASGKTFERRAIFVEGPGLDGDWHGEDYAFCNSCARAGIDVWIDPDIPFFHRGQKRWGGTLANSMNVFDEKASKHKVSAAA